MGCDRAIENPFYDRKKVDFPLWRFPEVSTTVVVGSALDQLFGKRLEGSKKVDFLLRGFSNYFFILQAHVVDLSKIKPSSPFDPVTHALRHSEPPTWSI